MPHVVQVGAALFGPFDSLAAAERWAADRPGAWARPVNLPSRAAPPAPTPLRTTVESGSVHD